VALCIISGCSVASFAAVLLQVFISDANSTAYQYPMVDAKVFRDASGAVAAEVPLVSLLAENQW
jgi:hypothetical protein